MNEESFQLILHAGNSKSSSMEAIAMARGGAMSDAKERLSDARKELYEAHRIQTELLVKESQGVRANPNMLMVHAQDHLSAAMVHLDLAEEILYVYDELQALRKEIGGLRK